MATTLLLPNTDLSATMLLLAATDHNISVLESLLKTTSANALDPETQQTALHVAIASCTPEDTAEELKAASETVKLLLQHGAIWNDLDMAGDTPGCIAERLGLMGLYELMVDAGVRAEMLLARLDAYQELSGGEDEEMSVDGGGEATEPTDISIKTDETGLTEPDKDNVTSAGYLASALTYHPDKLVDSDNNGVMMEWERGIMERSVEVLLPHKKPGRRVLNIGFGMGIIDTFFQAKQPAHHVVVEPHPDVLARLTADGWAKKPGVEILPGRWQDVPHPFPSSSYSLTSHSLTKQSKNNLGSPRPRRARYRLRRNLLRHLRRALHIATTVLLRIRCQASSTRWVPGRRRALLVLPRLGRG